MKPFKIQLILILFMAATLGGAAGFTNSQLPEANDDGLYDIVVVGGTPAGIMAAIAAEREGKRVLLLERTNHLGGLPANGLGATDLSTRGATGGLFMEFINRVHDHYKTTYGENSPQVGDSQGGYRFEPSVAEAAFEEMLKEHPGVSVLRMRQFDADQRYVTTHNGRIREVSVLNRETHERERYRGRIFVDATYEGDLAAAAGVPYHVGREGADEYEEPYAGRIYKYWKAGASKGSTFLPHMTPSP